PRGGHGHLVRGGPGGAGALLCTEAHHEGDRPDPGLRAGHHHGAPVPGSGEAPQEDDDGGAHMTPAQCPDLEVLFTELEAGEGPALDHAASCPLCSAVLGEHRQLEKDLYRLADPLPPPTLVASVMARVATEPTPLRRELWAGIPILVASLAVG